MRSKVFRFILYFYRLIIKKVNNIIKLENIEINDGKDIL